MKVFCIVSLFVFGLTACQTTTPTAATECRIFQPITYSVKDTRHTTRPVRRRASGDDHFRDLTKMIISLTSTI
jgi:hypothetical protein